MDGHGSGLPAAALAGKCWPAHRLCACVLLHVCVWDEACCCHTRCHTHAPRLFLHSAPPHNLALSPNLPHGSCLRLMPCSLARGVRWACLC
jgi:hypothetical protein